MFGIADVTRRRPRPAARKTTADAGICRSSRSEQRPLPRLPRRRCRPTLCVLRKEAANASGSRSVIDARGDVVPENDRSDENFAAGMARARQAGKRGGESPAQPGMRAPTGACESSVSSACANMPLAQRGQ